MRQRVTGILAIVLLVSVFLRLAIALYLGDVVDAPPLLTDQRSYHALGASLVAGQGFSFNDWWYPFTPPHKPTAHWSFLYSFFVAAVYGVFGVHPLAVRLVQAVLGGLLLPLMVYRLTRTLLSSATLGQSMARWSTGTTRDPARLTRALPLVAAGLCAVYAYFALYAATLMTETFYMVALLWSLERALVFRTRPALANGAWLGLSLGVATLLRQSILPWIVVLCLWELWVGHAEKRLRPVFTGLLTALVLVGLMILPFTIRNYRVYGQFLLLNSNAGYAMYSAQHPMHGTQFQEFAAAPIPDDLVGLNEAQLDRALMQRGIGFVLAEPGRYLLLSLSRAEAFVEFWPSAGSGLLNNIGRVGSFGLFLPFMICGLWMVLRRSGLDGTRAAWQRFAMSPVGMLCLFAIFYSLLHILTWAMPRYRLPVDAVALPFAAVAFLRLGLWLFRPGHNGALAGGEPGVHRP